METKSKLLIAFLICYLEINVYGQHLDGFELEINKVSIADKDLTRCLNNIIPYIMQKYPVDRKKDVICVNFSYDGDTFSVYPKTMFYGFTDWLLYQNNYEVTGYLMINRIMVIFLGKQSLPYLKMKAKKIKVFVENYPPGNSLYRPYWHFAVNLNGKKYVLINKDEPSSRRPFW